MSVSAGVWQGHPLPDAATSRPSCPSAPPGREPQCNAHMRADACTRDTPGEGEFS